MQDSLHQVSGSGCKIGLISVRGVREILCGRVLVETMVLAQAMQP